MEIAQKKLSLIEWLASLKDESIIQQIEEIRKLSFIKKYESSLKPMTNEELIASIQVAEADLKYGRDRKSVV